MTVAISALLIISVHGQGFQNLNFESAFNLPGNPGNGESVSVANALPGWTAYDGEFAYPNIYYVSNNLLGSATSVELEGGSLALSGDYSVELFLGGSISQTGLVPENADALEFEASSSPNLYVSLDGQNLSYSAIFQGSGYTVYAANIPVSTEGQVEALTFSIQGSGQSVLDDIEFTTDSVPEPSQYALIGLGAALFGLYRRHRYTANQSI